MNGKTFLRVSQKTCQIRQMRAFGLEAWQVLNVSSLKLRVFLGCLCLVLSTCVGAQTDPVKLDSAVLHPLGTTRIAVLDSFNTFPSNNLGEVLRDRGLVFIKSAPGNSLSTLSIRGGTAEQSTVFWNGLSLQSTHNGNVDASLLPSIAFDEIAFNSSKSTNTGSGNISGSLNLRNRSIDTTRLITAQLGVGSFNRYDVAVKYTAKAKRSASSVLLFGNSAENNYPYQRLRGTGTEQLEHAEFFTSGLLVHHKRFNKKSNPLNVRMWLQQTERQIPATLLEAESKKYQQDYAARVQSDWSKIKGKNEFQINGGMLAEQLDYQDSVSGIYTHYWFANSTLMLHAIRTITSRLKVGVDMEGRDYHALADTFYKQDRQEFAQALHGQYRKGGSLVNASIRWVQITGNDEKPLLFSASYKRNVNANLKVFVQTSSNYRMPTFNNLFWNPGGSPNLTAEKSWNSEVTALYTWKGIDVRLTAFNTRITNQIRWLPGSDGYFVATQVDDETQWNRGVELGVNYSYKGISAFVNTTVVKSTVDSFSLFEGLQQTYTPQIQGNSGLRYKLGLWLFNYGNWFVSKRYLDIENQTSEPGVFIHFVGVQRKLGSLIASLSVRNAGNVFYTLFPFQPNPPRNINFRITYQLNRNSQ